jgi:UDP-2-acetamido-2,6-beta-L-arabino-hexul-4-ose reductase
VIFRLQNVFGKWSRPNYNSVVATFCHNIAHDLPIQISDVNRELELVYIDDVIEALMGCLDEGREVGSSYREIKRTQKVKLGEVAQKLNDFRVSRHTLVAEYPDLFTKRLHATYLSYIGEQDLCYELTKREDDRGSLAEFIKSKQFGQIFVSRTKPGIARGNHYHHSKVEKFLVLEGEAVIRLRSLIGDRVVEYRVTGDAYRVVDIPPGYAHSIENIGTGVLVTLFWSSDIFDPSLPDTIPCQV